MPAFEGARASGGTPAGHRARPLHRAHFGAVASACVVDGVRAGAGNGSLSILSWPETVTPAGEVTPIVDQRPSLPPSPLGDDRVLNDSGTQTFRVDPALRRIAARPRTPGARNVPLFDARKVQRHAWASAALRRRREHRSL